MTDPIVEQIAIVLFARLRTIKTDAGYNYTASNVVRPKRVGGYSPEHLLIVQSQGNPRPDPGNSVEGNPYRIAWVQPFIIATYVKPSDDDHEPVDAIVNRFAADVCKAVATISDPGDTSNDWVKFGELAHNAAWADPSGFETEKGEYEGTLLNLEVTYRVNETSPYIRG